MAQEKLNKIGALWLKKSQAGNPFLSGNVELDKSKQKGSKVSLLIMKNRFKEEDERENPGKVYPDYVIYDSEPQQGRRESRDDVPF